MAAPPAQPSLPQVSSLLGRITAGNDGGKVLTLEQRRPFYPAVIFGAGILVLIVATFLIWPASYEGLIATIMSSLSIFERYAHMFYGMFDFGHIVFFISLIIFFLYITYQVVEKKRWS